MRKKHYFSPSNKITTGRNLLPQTQSIIGIIQATSYKQKEDPKSHTRTFMIPLDFIRVVKKMAIPSHGEDEKGLDLPHSMLVGV